MYIIKCAQLLIHRLLLEVLAKQLTAELKCLRINLFRCLAVRHHLEDIVCLEICLHEWVLAVMEKFTGWIVIRR